jgi:hypothetical protein
LLVLGLLGRHRESGGSHEEKAGAERCAIPDVHGGSSDLVGMTKGGPR